MVRGFTLLEVLVALAIFAVLSLAGWKVFDGVIKTRERNQAYTEQLSALQAGYNLLLRDMSQIVARPVRQGSGVLPALVLDHYTLSFTRLAGFDPTQPQGSSLERITYQYNAGTQQLIRTSYKQPDQTRLPTPPDTVILEKISDFSIKALDPSPQERWPANSVMLQLASPGQPTGESQLPAGIEISLVHQQQPILWRFSLVRTLPQPLPAPKPAS